MGSDKEKGNKFLKMAINMKEIGCGIKCMGLVRWYILMVVSMKGNGYWVGEQIRSTFFLNFYLQFNKQFYEYSLIIINFYFKQLTT